MLLVFFLVTTSMYVDKGLSRNLPPVDDEQQEEMMMDKENILALSLDADGRLSANDSVISLDSVSQRLQEFIVNRGAKHLITLDCDPDCSYDHYFALQNTIVDTYSAVRDAAARKEYGRPLSQCRNADREKILSDYPQRLAENYREKGGNEE